MKSAETRSTASASLPGKSAAGQSAFFQKENAGSTPVRAPGGFFSPGGTADVQPFFAKPTVQPKLRIGEPGDKYEQEADTMADEVVQRMAADPAPPAPPEDGERPRNGLSAETTVQRKCASCAAEEAAPVRRQGGTAGMATPAGFDAQLQSSKGGGAPLEKNTKTQMERAFSADFSNVRIHRGSDAAEMNESVQAKAFTHGNDIYFDHGKYDPASTGGQHLLAHELTHVVQQNGSAVQRQPAGPDTRRDYQQTQEPRIQRFGIPFTDYETDFSLDGLKTAGGLVAGAAEKAGDKIKEGVTTVKDAAVSSVEWVVEKISGLVNEGIAWLKEKYAEVTEFATSAFESIKGALSTVVSLVQDPVNTLVHALDMMNADGFLASWNMLKSGAQAVWNSVKTTVDQVLSIGTGLWSTVTGYVDSAFGRIESMFNSTAFSLLPDFLADKARSLFNTIKGVWESMRDYWTEFWGRLTAFVSEVLDSIQAFVTQLLDFAVEGVINAIRSLREMYDYVSGIVNDPEGFLRRILQPIADKITGQGPGESQAVLTDKLTESSGDKAPAASPGGVIQRAPTTGAVEERSTAPYAEVDAALKSQLALQWAKLDIWTMLWDSVVNMFWPPATIRAIGHEFYELWTTDWTNAANSLFTPRSIFDTFGGFWHDVWSNILVLLDFPFLLIRRLLNILMLLMGYVTIILVLVGNGPGLALAFAIGEALFVAFLLNESTYVLKMFAALFTARQTRKEKNREYQQIAASVIGIGIGILIALIFMVLAEFVQMVMRGIKGGPLPETAGGKGGKGGKGGEPGEPGETGPKSEASTKELPKLEGESASIDGERSVVVANDGKIWVCASPCEHIRLKYEAEIAADPSIENRIKALEDGYADLTPEQKAARETQVKQLEQELANAKAKAEGKPVATAPGAFAVGEQFTIPYKNAPARAKIIEIKDGLVKFEYVSEVGPKNSPVGPRSVPMKVLEGWLKDGSATRWSEARVALMKNRPPYEPGLVEKVWEKAKGPDGKVRDPNSPSKELNWDKSKSRFDQWHMGHKPGKEYAKLVDSYSKGDITYEDFVKEYNNPDNYQPELPENNLSHKFEQK